MRTRAIVTEILQTKNSRITGESMNVPKGKETLRDCKSNRCLNYKASKEIFNYSKL